MDLPAEVGQSKASAIAQNKGSLAPGQVSPFDRTLQRMSDAQRTYNQKLDALKEQKNVLICHYCQRKVSVEDDQNNNEAESQQMEIDSRTCCGV